MQSLLTEDSLLRTTVEGVCGLGAVSVACGLIPGGFVNRLGRRRCYANRNSNNDLYIVEGKERLNVSV